MMKDMVEQVALMTELCAEHETMIPNIAKIYAKMLNELIKEGFTREEAMEIVTRQGFKMNAS